MATLHVPVILYPNVTSDANNADFEDGCFGITNWNLRVRCTRNFVQQSVKLNLKLKSSLGLLHLGLIERHSVPHIQIVPSVISRGAPHHAAREASINEGRKLHTRILPSARNKLQLMGSYTCPKVGTWDMLRIFSGEKIRRLRPGTREPEASMRTTRPPKPLQQSVAIH
jgi:hypothetical protein